VPVRSFDSGHPKFDSLVREALQADRHPFVEIDGMIRRGRFEGTLTLRGASCPLAMPVTIVRAGRQIVLETSFGFNLTQFGVALPGVGSRVIVDFVARISAGPHAVEAGGALSSN
jgi:polyisoprenoid-binding protein YceI